MLPKLGKLGVKADTGSTEIKSGAAKTSSTVAGDDKITKTTSGPGVHETGDRSSLDQVTTPKHHRAVTNLLSENVVTPVYDTTKVPNNSPANISNYQPSSVLPTTDQTTDPFTREEAHDVVIDIFKELAALSERSKNSPSNKTQSRQSTPLVESGKANKSSAYTQASPSKYRQPTFITPPKGSPNPSPVKYSGGDENVPLFMKAKGKQAEMRFDMSPTKDDTLPPHLRNPTGKISKPPASPATPNYFSVLDPLHRSSVSPKTKEASTGKNSGLGAAVERKQKPPGLRSLSTSSAGTSSTPTPPAEAREEVAKFGLVRREDTKPEAVSESVSPTLSFNAGVTLPADPKPQDEPRESKGKERETSVHEATAKLEVLPWANPNLPSWILEKYGSKKSATPSKAARPDENPEEDLEHQTVFKKWPGRAERSHPGNASYPP